MDRKHFFYSPEVQAALDNLKPIVALESTVTAHGLPRPQNLQTAQRLEQIVRDGGAVPATIAVLEGKLCVGLSAEQLQFIAEHDNINKVSIRDLPIAVAQKWNGATTVASTSWIAQRAGIKVFATGGIGGVHRGALPDVSGDLPALATTSLIVVCSGAKIVLDVPATREWLETHGITVIGYQCDELPAFYSRSSGLPVDVRVDAAYEVAEVFVAQQELSIKQALLVTVPVPVEVEVPAAELDLVLEAALSEAAAQRISGRDLTPFLLSRMAQQSGGATLRANIALLENNARVAAQISRQITNHDRPTFDQITQLSSGSGVLLYAPQTDTSGGIMANERENCENAPCGCPRPEDSKYCSAACEGTGDTIQLDCDCGHPDCSGNF